MVAILVDVLAGASEETRFLSSDNASRDIGFMQSGMME